MHKASLKRSDKSGGTIIYCRLSLAKDGSTFGVDRQEKECRDLAERQGWSVAKVLVDNDISATTGKRRPAFEELLASNPERILVWHTDRLVRLSSELERIIDLEVNVHAVTAGHLDLSHPAGRAVAKTVTAWAQYEGEQKAERQKAQQRQRVLRGSHWWSQRPFGYEMDGSHREDEAALLRDGYRRMLGGTARWVDLSRTLNDKGMRTSKGNRWTPTTTAQLYRSPRNAGLLTTNGEVVGKGQWKPIVSEEEWRTALGLTGRESLMGRGQGTRKGLLSGIASCAVCDATVMLRSRSAKARGLKKLYGCPHGHVSAPTEWLDDLVGKAIVRRLLEPASLLAFSVSDTTGKDRTALMVKAHKLRERLDEIADMFAEGEITREQSRRMTARVRVELDAVQQDLDRAYFPSPLGNIDGPSAALEAWRREDAPLDERRAIVLFLLAAAKIQRKRNGERAQEDHVELVWREW